MQTLAIVWVSPLGTTSWFQDHWAITAIALTCFSLLVFFALLIAKYVRICLNIFVDTPPPLATGPLDFQPIHGEVVRFRSIDGRSLRGMHIHTPNRKAVKGTIVFCHEYGSDMYSCARYTRPLIEAGFDIFTFDYRGHGKSANSTTYKPLQWPSNQELGDTLGACAYVQSCLEAEGRPRDIGLFGISRGAGSGLLAAASDPHIKAVICDGAFSTDTTLTHLMKRWAYIFTSAKLMHEYHPDWFWTMMFHLLMIPAQRRLGCRYPSVRKALRDMPSRPIFFIHGQKDSYIREDQTRLLHGDAPEPKYLWIAENAKHNQSVIVHPRLYAQRTTAFFCRYLAGETIAEDTLTAPEPRQAGVVA